MFEGFETVKDEQSRKRWFASTGTSLIIVAIIGIGAAVLMKQQVQKAQAEPEIDVSFSPEPEETKKEAPPPPPPPPKAKAPKVKRPGKVAPVQPTVIPEARPSEADPTGDHATSDEIIEYGDGELGGMTEETKPPPPPPPPPPPVVEERDEPTPDPVDEIDTSFVRAEPMAGNERPVYPEAARKKGTEAVVRLKVKISAAGDVTDVSVVSGDEPFASAAIAAVRTWRWKPATDAGKKVASTRLVDIPFRLQSR